VPSDSAASPSTESASRESLLETLREYVEAIVAAERVHPETVTPTDRVTVGALYAVLVETREVGRLTRWLIVLTVALLIEALAEFVLFFFFK
jgi:hypothetical protein